MVQNFLLTLYNTTKRVISKMMTKNLLCYNLLYQSKFISDTFEEKKFDFLGINIHMLIIKVIPVSL